jgi:hypothetical protein
MAGQDLLGKKPRVDGASVPRLLPPCGILGESILAMDFIETVTLTGQRQYILAAIHQASQRVRILGTTAHPHPCLGHPGCPQPAYGPRRLRAPRADQIPHP